MQEHLNPDMLLSRSEVHTTFGISQRFLEVAVVRGGGPRMVKIGRTVRYRVGDLQEWINARRVPAWPPAQPASVRQSMKYAAADTCSSPKTQNPSLKGSRKRK